MNSCVTLPGFQNGRTIPMGEQGWMVGTSYQSVEVRLDSMEDKTVITPLFVVARRKGLTDRIDYGTYFSSGAAFFADAKYQFVGSHTSSLALSTGLGVGTTGFVGPNASYQFILPLYSSWHLSDRFSLYFSPQASVLWSNRENRFINAMILSGGMGIGNRQRFVINVSYTNKFGVEEGVGKAIDFGIAYKFPGKKTLILPWEKKRY